MAGPLGFVDPGSPAAPEAWDLLTMFPMETMNWITLSTNDYLYWISWRIIWKHLCRKKANLLMVLYIIRVQGVV